MENKLLWSGERCVPEHMRGEIKILQSHYARYVFSLMYCRNKSVLDASSGSGYGTNMLYDIAKDILGVDISLEAINYAREKYNGKFEVCDLNKEWPRLGNDDLKVDITVSFETIEHLINPDYFINNVRNNSKEFLFSIPINLPSKFHKSVFTVDSVKILLEKYYLRERISWVSQMGLNINNGISSKVRFLIGHAKV